MPVPERTVTKEIAENIVGRVDEYNQCNPTYVKEYNCFMKQRDKFLALHGVFVKTLNELSFCIQLHDVLVDFGLNARASVLMSPKRILDVVSRVGSEFDLLNSANIRLHSLNLRQKLGNQMNKLIIRQIFRHFAKPNHITKAGGFVAASKTMHFIMPELFIILDGKHIAISLYNIADYNPNINEGANWATVIPNYSGKKPNPSPRGAGRKSWDDERYVIALMYYKRVIHEWGQQNKADLRAFLAIDGRNDSTASRIIDKALW